MAGRFCPGRTTWTFLSLNYFAIGKVLSQLCGVWANSKSFLLARGRRADRVGQQATQRTASTGMAGQIPISSEELP